jgi:hypothetical protein
MALTPTEEAQVKQLLAQQAPLLTLADSEPTIMSKLGASKVNLSQLGAATALTDSDIMLLRQGVEDKSVSAGLVKSFAAMPIATVAEAQSLTDNSKVMTPATTRAILGNYSNFIAVSTSMTLTQAFAGRLIFVSAAPATITLPRVSDTADGKTFTIFHSGGSGVVTLTVEDGSGDLFIDGVAAGTTTLSMSAGDTIVIASSGGNRWVKAGGNGFYRTTHWQSTDLNSGYIKYRCATSPTGYITRQWTKIIGVPMGGSSNFTWPVALSGRVLNYWNSGDGGANSASAQALSMKTTLTGGTVYNWGNSFALTANVFCEGF